MGDLEPELVLTDLRAVFSLGFLLSAYRTTGQFGGKIVHFEGV